MRVGLQFGQENNRPSSRGENHYAEWISGQLRFERSAYARVKPMPELSDARSEKRVSS